MLNLEGMCRRRGEGGGVAEGVRGSEFGNAVRFGRRGDGSRSGPKNCGGVVERVVSRTSGEVRDDGAVTEAASSAGRHRRGNV